MHDVAEHVGADHMDIVLDNETLVGPRACGARGRQRARPARPGIGDMDASLYLLFQAIREHSTVALSGESADELFGGYQQFHDPRIAAGRRVPVARRRTTG